MQVHLFKKFLLDGNRADPREVEQYALWIYRFFTLKLSSQLSNTEKISEFVDSLALDESLDEEQRSVAKNALWIYLNDFIADDESSSPSQNRSTYLLLDTLRGFLQLKKYSANTVKIYVDWVARYVNYCAESNSKCNETDQVVAFLDYLTKEAKVSPSTRNQALNALSFLFVNVFDSDLNHIKTSSRNKTERQLPEILNCTELQYLFAQLMGQDRLMLQFIYGTGVTISEFCRMRINALDFDNHEVAVFDDNTFDERTVPMPEILVERLKEHLEELKKIHSADLLSNHGSATFTTMMKEKFAGQEKELRWQYLFPSKNITNDKKTGESYRGPIPGRTVQAVMKKAVDIFGFEKKVSIHTLRHSFATHLLLNGISFQDLQMLLGHKNIETTMMYNQILKKNYRKPFSPLDLL